jgi:hypothetical protein
LNDTPNFNPFRFHQYHFNFKSETHILFAHSSAITHTKIKTASVSVDEAQTRAMGDDRWR